MAGKYSGNIKYVAEVEDAKYAINYSFKTAKSEFLDAYDGWKNDSNPSTYQSDSGVIQLATPELAIGRQTYEMLMGTIVSDCYWTLNGEKVTQLDTSTLSGDIELVWTCDEYHG